MNSPWTFRYNKLFLRNPTNTFSYNFIGGAISNNYQVSAPVITANDQLLFQNASQRVFNKIIDVADGNTIVGSAGGGSASNKKTGLIQCPRTGTGGSYSQGMLAGHIDMGDPVLADADPPPVGTAWKYASGTTSNTVAGLRYNQVWIRRDFNPRLKVKYETPDGALDHDFFFGFSTDTDITATQNPLETTNSGLLVGYRSTDTNLMVIRNGGTNSASSTPTFTDTGSSNPKGSQLRTIEISFTGTDGTTANVLVQTISLSAPFGATTTYTNTFTTNLPALTSGTASVYMRPVFQIANKTATNKRLWLSYMELDQLF